jgi:hypothetical protein
LSPYLPQAIVEWSLEQLRSSQEDVKAQQQRELEKLQERHRGLLAKRSTLVDPQLDTDTRMDEALYKDKLRELSKEAEDIQGVIRDFEAHAKQWALDLYDAIQFTLGVRERFAMGNPIEKLDTLLRLGSRIELRGKSLQFKPKEP